MPLTSKGEKILAAMKKEYGEEKGESVFYASKNAGKISGVDSADAAAGFPSLDEMQFTARVMHPRRGDDVTRDAWYQQALSTQQGAEVAQPQDPLAWEKP